MILRIASGSTLERPVKMESLSAIRGVLPKSAWPRVWMTCVEMPTTEEKTSTLNSLRQQESAGGGRGIRTLDTVSRIHAFQACAFNHSATPPFACAQGATHRQCSPRASHAPHSPAWRKRWCIADFEAVQVVTGSGRATLARGCASPYVDQAQES
jgi:hypothetical protein